MYERKKKVVTLQPISNSNTSQIQTKDVRQEVKKLQDFISYSNFLVQLRNKKTQLPYKKFCQAGLQLSQLNTLSFPSEDNTLNNFYHFESQTARNGLKFSMEACENPMNENMLYISQKMDQHLETGLGIPCLEIPSAKPSTSKREMKCIFSPNSQESQDQLPESCKNLELNLLNLNTRNKVEFLAEKLIKKNLAQSKIMIGHQMLNGEVGFKVRNTSKNKRIFDKTETCFYDKKGKEQGKQKNKENTPRPTVTRNQEPQQEQTRAEARKDLQEVIQSFGNKMHRYRLNYMMTKKREEAIFFNQLMKKGGKKNNYGSMASQIREEVQKLEKCKNKKPDEEEQVVENLKKNEFSIKNVLEIGRKKLEYLNKIPLERL